MALASSWYDHSAPRSTGLRAAVAVAVLALPFAAVSLRAGDYLSFDHAALRAMAAHLRTGHDAILFSYPPLPLWIATLLPQPALAAAIAAGALLWLTVRRLEERGFGVASRVLLVGAAVAHPTVLFALTQSVQSAFALLFLALAWIHYCDFLATRHTRSAFAAGLTLAAAFFVGPHALAFAVVMALLAAPLLDEPEMRGRAAAAFVLAFPAVGCVLAFAYVQWSADARAEWFLPALFLDGGVVSGWARIGRIAGELAGDLRMTPLYAVAAVAAAWARPARLAIFAAPPMVLLALGAAGMRQPQGFAAALLVVMAVISLPAGASARARAALVVIAVGQTLAAYSMLPSEGESARWMAAVFQRQPSPVDAEERAIAREIAMLPPGSVWADPDKTTRIIARLNSTAPFLITPGRWTVEAPPGNARYVLLRNRPDFDPNPHGLRMHRFWSNWTLYARNADLRQ